MAIEIKLDAYEGPLDLLLQLINANKVDIYDIPIVTITDQYLEYVAQMEKEDLNVVSEFLVMAAMLLDIKSKMLLPKQETETEEGETEDPRQELVEKLLEYKMYKAMSYELKDMMLDAEKSMYRESSIPPEIAAYEEPVDLNELMSDVTLVRLREIFNDVMKRQVDKIDPVRSKFGKIEKEEVNMDEKTAHVTEYIRSHRRCSFRQLLGQSKTRMQVIVTFLVVLELIKGGKISVVQENRKDDIIITALEEAAE